MALAIFSRLGECKEETAEELEPERVRFDEHGWRVLDPIRGREGTDFQFELWLAVVPVTDLIRRLLAIRSVFCHDHHCGAAICR